MLIQEDGREGRKIRPYVKVVSDNKVIIHFAFTDDHPRDEPLNSIYYMRYHKGAFYKADGTRIGDMKSLPIPHSMSDTVYEGHENTRLDLGHSPGQRWASRYRLYPSAQKDRPPLSLRTLDSWEVV